MPKNKITMNQIAQKAGVSQPTVSIVLSGSEGISISEETKNKVFLAAEELGYKKRTNTKSYKKLKFIFIVDGSVYPNEHFTLSFNAASQKAQELNTNITFYNTLYTDSGRKDILLLIENKEYDAAIVASTMTNYEAIISNLKIPTVYLNCIPKNNYNVVSILPDDYACSYKLIKNVYKKYKKPAILAGDIWMQATLDRLKAIRDLYQSININIDESNIFYTSWSFKKSFNITLELLKKEHRPDILICASDHIALGAYQAIYYAGLRIPDDIAVIGFDNQYICTELTPELTTIELPYAQMAELAVTYAHALCEKKLEGLEKIKKVCGDVFLRGSC